MRISIILHDRKDKDLATRKLWKDINFIVSFPAVRQQIKSNQVSTPICKQYNKMQYTWQNGLTQPSHNRWKLCSVLPKMLTKSFFRETRFRSIFFTKPPLHLFSRPNGLCGSFRGENSTRICLKCSWNRFLKNTFLVWIFLQNRTLTYFWGQTDYVARFERKTSLVFA